MYSLRHNMVDISHTNMMNLFQVKNFTACWSSCLLPIITQNELPTKLHHIYFFTSAKKTGCLIYIKTKSWKTVLIFGQNYQMKDMIFITLQIIKDNLIYIHKTFCRPQNFTFLFFFSFYDNIIHPTQPTNLNFMIGIKLEPSRMRGVMIKGKVFWKHNRLCITKILFW